MMSVLISLLLTVRISVRSRTAPQIEVLALRHQLLVLERSRPRRLRLRQADRLLWVWLSRVWTDWRAALVIVKPETVIAWTEPPALPGPVEAEALNDAMVRRRRPPSQTWRTFLANHLGQLVAADFFVVPTATCRLLFVLVLLAHDRRRVLHVAVTQHPTATWTAQQLREAFPWDQASRFLIRDRDHAFDGLAATAEAIGIHEVITAPHPPWQNAYIEDAPAGRLVASQTAGRIVAIPLVGGLHHRYERRAA